MRVAVGPTADRRHPRIDGLTTQLTFADGQQYWIVDLTDTERITAVHLQRTRPRPF